MRGPAKQFATQKIFYTTTSAMQQHVLHNKIRSTEELFMKGCEKQFAAQKHLLHNIRRTQELFIKEHGKPSTIHQHLPHNNVHHTTTFAEPSTTTSAQQKHLLQTSAGKQVLGLTADAPFTTSAIQQQHTTL